MEQACVKELQMFLLAWQQLLRNLRKNTFAAVQRSTLPKENQILLLCKTPVQ